MTGLNCLLKTPVQQWKIDQVIVFDWCDGPRQGIASLTDPKCEFAFKFIAEIANTEDLDDRYFSLKELPLGAVSQIRELLKPLGKPTNTVWVPNWDFSEESKRKIAEEKIDDLLAKALPSSIVVHSQDMASFLGCWDMAASKDLPELPTLIQPHDIRIV